MFAQTMENYTETRNGALTYKTPDMSGIYKGRLSLLFQTVRGASSYKVEEHLSKTCNESLIDAFILAFYTRDCRGGKGERDIGIKLFTYLYNNYPDMFMKIVHKIPEYGRWDDLHNFFPTNNSNTNNICQEYVLDIYCKQLVKDYNSMMKGESISLLAKWAPTENDSKDKIYKFVNLICNKLNITPKVYRKKYIVPLRTYLKIVEQMMCSRKWDDIDFSKVPSCAMKRLKKCFEKNAFIAFNDWKNKLKTGTVKVNAKQLFPHEIVREIRKNKICDEVTLAQWNVLEEEMKKMGTFTKTLVVVDTSSSMQSNDFLPLDIACAMGLMISNIVDGEFHNNVITFNSTPEFIKLQEGSIYNRYIQLKNIPWGGNTDIQRTFEMILSRCRSAKLHEKDMPDKIFIISDMQFDNICPYNTNFKEIENLYAKYNYKRPDIIFWNVDGSIDNFPVTISDNGVCLISGASHHLIQSILNSDIDMLSILNKILYSERYKEIRNILST